MSVILGNSVRVRRLSWITVVASALFLAALIWHLGCAPLNQCPWDLAVQLDGGWRLLNGQLPHRDFYSPLGVIPLLVSALGMVVAPPSASAVAYGTAVLLPVICLWSWTIARDRVPPVPAAAFSIMNGLLFAAPRSLDGAFRATTYAMQYNRYGWALLGIVLLEVFLGPEDRVRANSKVVGPTSTGAALALMLFCKFNYFLAGAAALVLGAVLIGWSLRRFVILGLSFSSAAAVLLAFLRFDVASLGRDLVMLSGVQHTAARLGAILYVAGHTCSSVWILSIPFLIAFLDPLWSAAAGFGRFSYRAHAFPVAAILVLGVVTCSTNAETAGIPVFAVGSLIMMENARRGLLSRPTLHSRERCQATPLVTLTLLICAYFLGSTFLPDVSSLVYSGVWQRMNASEAHAANRMLAPDLRDMLLPASNSASPGDVTTQILERDPASPGLAPCQYAAWVNDGIRLLTPHLTGGSRVFVMDWLNPFSFALLVRPPRGDALFWHYGRVVDYAHAPLPGAILGEVTTILVPRRPLAPETAAFLTTYLFDAVATDFHKVDESALWILYQRNKLGQTS
jgi:hypothetical protein